MRRQYFVAPIVAALCFAVWGEEPSAPKPAANTDAKVPCAVPATPASGAQPAAADAKTPSAEWQDAGVGAPQIEADWLHADELRAGAGGKAAAHAAPAKPNVAVKPEEDAAGAVDGVIDGKWGFHTLDEEKPWWQVDLGKPTALDRVVCYNRGDACQDRIAKMLILLSDDGKEFKQVFQNNGTIFGGHADKKPLSAELKGASGRYVRLQLPGKSHFHLDEVEVYAPGSTENVARGKPATQSSVSEWSAVHKVVAPAPKETKAAADAKEKAAPAKEASSSKVYSTEEVIERGMKLAENLKAHGVNVDAQVKALDEAAAQMKALPADATDEAKRKICLDAHWAVRRMALSNPLVDFDTILFTKGAPGRFPHMSDQNYGWWSRPGGGVFLLKDWRGEKPQVKCITASFAPGNFQRPDLSYDGKKVLFAYCKYYSHVPELKDKATKANLPEDAFYHIFEMNADGSGVTQLTHGRYDDFDARYLPSGEIVFVSTRKGDKLQLCKSFSEATNDADQPDSYVRCGGDNYRPVPVFTMHLMNADGKNLRPLSAFENFEWTPEVANNGSIIYTRWDYIDRFNGHFFSMWSTNPDGSNPALVYKNYTIKPQVSIETRPIPNSDKLIFTASAHHSITGGSLCLLDRNRGMEGLDPLVRLTPEVPFPETEKNGKTYYLNPYPLSEDHYLCAWSDKPLPPHCRVDDTNKNPVNATGVYLYDAFGNLNLVYRDAEISSGCPIPLRPRHKPPVYPTAVAWDGPQEGNFLLQDVYHGLGETKRGTIKRLRVIAVPPKVQPHMNNPNLGVSSEDPGKYMLGTVPVEEDGSAYFRVPSGVPVFFQALDADGMAVQTMRTLTYVWPGQTLSCIGCHETRDAAPPSGGKRMAAQREPSKLTPGPEGTWPWRFDKLVQPLLDQNCISCHKEAPKVAGAEYADADEGASVVDPEPQKEPTPEQKAAALELTAGKAWKNLLNFGNKDLQKLVYERDRSTVGDTPSRKSKLLAALKDKNHESVKLDAAAMERLITWMDVYAQQKGHYSDKQEEQLIEFRQKLTGMLEK
ncbi:MAG TPA: discoidin domain-containing protein [Planctomycetota bacterium]|jgi:hypothetical protein